MILNVNLGEGYDIILERGCLGCAEKYLNLDRKVMIVTDEGVPSEYVEKIAAACREAHIFAFAPGEESKTLATFEKILRKMLDAGFTRGDAVAAVGGGVAGDMAGFAASAYMRGVDFYNIPTTVLSQLDSSIGGKTAVNLDNVKNIVGAFYQPKRVLIDVDTTKTLTRRQIAAGLAEALKMSMTSDPELFDIFENKDPFSELDLIIEKGLRIKKDVVEKDEKETGLRKILNFGHTIGHGVECASQSEEEPFMHGECVAMGMIPMSGEDVRQRLVRALEKLGLPTSCSLKKDDIYSAMLHDKKSLGDGISAVYVDEIGSFRLEKTGLDRLSDLIGVISSGKSV